VLQQTNATQSVRRRHYKSFFAILLMPIKKLVKLILRPIVRRCANYFVALMREELREVENKVIKSVCYQLNQNRVDVRTNLDSLLKQILPKQQKMLDEVKISYEINQELIKNGEKQLENKIKQLYSAQLSELKRVRDCIIHEIEKMMQFERKVDFPHLVADKQIEVLEHNILQLYEKIEGYYKDVKECSRNLASSHSDITQEFYASSNELLKSNYELWEAFKHSMERHITVLSNVPIEHFTTQTDLILERIDKYSYMSARRFAIPCGENTVLVRTAIGYVLCPAEDFALLSFIIESGELERGTRLVIEKILQPGDVFIDVGANIGMHSLAAARVMRGMGTIIAFEPFPETVVALNKTIALNCFNQIIQVQQKALANRQGKNPFYLGKTCGHHSLYSVPTQGSALTAIEVELTTLDSALPPLDKINLIKIDVEGAELDVLAGARKTLEKYPDLAMIIEFDKFHIERTGSTVESWLSQVIKLGFDYKIIDEENGQLVVPTQELLKKESVVNLFFAKPSSPYWAVCS
jgi:FkbM family methyltransferase